ncbi:MAG: FtsW/RodA/SpoVE family cell cycle protein [Candidatus Saccharimonadales bacterium]
MFSDLLTKIKLASFTAPTPYPSFGSKELVSFGRRHRPDYWLVALCIILLTIGLVVIFSISPAMSEVYHISNNYYVEKQLLAILLGLIAFIVAAKIPLTTWIRFVKPLIIIAVGATLLAVIMPVNPSYPAHRWVRLGSFSFQSVEFLKFVLIIWLAKLLAENIIKGSIKNVQQTLKPIIIVLVAVGVVVAGIQSDLGSMGVIVVIIGIMLFIAGVPLKKIAMIIGIITIGLILSIAVIPYRRERLMTFLNPTSNCQAENYQACQAVIGVGSGGMAGLGLGNSVQAYGYLPESVNDSIFAIYAEKFGFIGSVILLALFVGLFARIKSVAEHAPDDFSRLIVIGILSWLSVQTLINVGAMIGVLPLKGITLPFISYGGTSIVFALAAVGLVFQVSAYTTRVSAVSQSNRGLSHDNSSDRRRFGGAYHPNPSNS